MNIKVEIFTYKKIYIDKEYTRSKLEYCKNIYCLHKYCLTNCTVGYYLLTVNQKLKQK